MRSILRFILLPFSFLYGLIVQVRNLLYDKRALHSVEFDLPVICVGNLALGGTGKTPMVEYLISLFGAGDHIAVLSRGYKRKTRGFLIAKDHTNASQIGDEPMQMHRKYPKITIVVAEQRVPAIPQILTQNPHTQVIILDDAFQHRSLRAGLNILLTTYANPFTRDYYLPSGHLRDNPSQARRADIIVVTKCPADMTTSKKDQLMHSLKQNVNQPVFFSTLRYGFFYSFFNAQLPKPDDKTTVLLVCGIANPTPLLVELNKITSQVEHMLFKDHHEFDQQDLERIRKRFGSIKATKKAIVVTEKDAARLHMFQDALSDLPILVWPVTLEFLFDEGPAFDKIMREFAGLYPEIA